MVNEENKDQNKLSTREMLNKVEEDNGQSFFTERKEYKEKELTPQEKLVREEIGRELDLMNQDENLKKESENKAQKIQYLGDEEKLKNLLDLAKQKGVIFAVKVAKDMNDPYILDTFHDILVKEGLWKNYK